MQTYFGNHKQVRFLIARLFCNFLKSQNDGLVRLLNFRFLSDCYNYCVLTGYESSTKYQSTEVNIRSTIQGRVKFVISKSFFTSFFLEFFLKCLNFVCN